MPTTGVLDDLNKDALPLPIDTTSQDSAASSTADAALPTIDTTTYDPTSYDASLKDLTGDQLVLNNVDKVLDKGGVLMDVARSTGDEISNSRGALNSSMGAEASMRSMVDAALPIASQDASSQLSQLQNNQAYENRAGEFNATAANTAGQFNSAAQNDTAKFNAANQVQQTRDSILQSYQLQMENLSTNNKSLLIDLEQKYSAAIQSDKNASDAYLQAMDSIGVLMSNGDLSEPQQYGGTASIIDMLYAYLDFNAGISAVNALTGDVVDDTLPTTPPAPSAAQITIQKTGEYNREISDLGSQYDYAQIARDQVPNGSDISQFEAATNAANAEWARLYAAIEDKYSEWL